MGRLFGTDGIRGPANVYPMTGEVAMAVGRAAAFVLAHGRSGKGKRPRIVVGKDTRLSGYMIETALVSGLLSMGADVIMIGPLPTPGVAFVTQSMRAQAGIMLSASHNPFEDNGIKLFSADGYKLPDHVEDEIERLAFGTDLVPHMAKGENLGRATRIEDAAGRYVVFLKSLFPKELDLSGVRLVIDCANGAGYKVAPLVFEELGAEVIRRGVSPNGTNINLDCGALHPASMAAATLEYRADMGIALDGDADRCILSDEKGEIIDGDQILGLCALELKRQGRLGANTVVATPMSNLGLEILLKENGVKLVRAPVGDRYVVETMRREGATLGGEQSGHLIFLEHATTGDGILGALRILEVVKRTGKTLSELKKQIPLYPQYRRDVRVGRKIPIEESAEIQAAIKKGTDALNQKGRVFVRYSGTEAVARVLVEGEDLGQIQQVTNDISSTLERTLA